MPKNKKAIVYTRVSTKGQEAVGAGLELQRISIEAFAREAGIEIAETFSDAHSGVGEDSLKKRPGIRGAIMRSRETGWPILVDGLDRFARDTKRLEELVVEGRLKVISVRQGETPQRAVMIAAAERAQAEAERISRTTKAGLERARAKGAVFGNPNIKEAQRRGVATNQRKADEFTRTLMPIITEICEQGRPTMAAIADEFNRRGLRSPRGQSWTKTTVRSQLNRIKELEARDRDERYRQNPLWGMF